MFDGGFWFPGDSVLHRLGRVQPSVSASKAARPPGNQASLPAPYDGTWPLSRTSLSIRYLCIREQKMNFWERSHYAWSSCAAAAILAGCGGSPPPLGAPGAMPQSRAIVQPASKGNLLYAAGPGDVLIIFSYPSGKHVATVNRIFVTGGICADAHGNVFVPVNDSRSQSSIYKFSHGGTKPVATLIDPGYATSCSSDPSTGNLAVANGSTVAIYKNAQGGPTVYATSSVPARFSAYDDKGNLFIDDGLASQSLAELPSGGRSFQKVSLDTSFYPMSLQWTAGHFAVAAYTNDSKGPQPFYNVTISGSNGIASGPIMLSTKNGKHPDQPVQFFLSGKTMMGPVPHLGGLPFLGFWKYPAGGDPTKILSSREGQFTAVTISVAPSR